MPSGRNYYLYHKNNKLAGVLDKRKHEAADSAKVAGSMHNMIAVEVDFGRALNLQSECMQGKVVGM